MRNPFSKKTASAGRISDPAFQRERIAAQNPRILDAAKAIATRVPKAYFVGGFVRDALLGEEPKDADLEVYGIEPERLESLLNECFPERVHAIGKAFGVLHVRLNGDVGIDVSLPRRESKIGRGHTGFLVESDPHMTLEDAARRRDFTMNALYADPVTHEVIDVCGGLKELERRVLRVVDPAHFPEDPLRVYRAVQFAARLEAELDPSSMELMRKMVALGSLAELSRERITEEIGKLLLKSSRPSIGFNLMRDLGLVERDYPELQALIGVEQEPEWHPEGDVWIHTLMVIDRAAEIIRQNDRGFEEREPLQVMMGALSHDLGKPATTEHLEGRIRSRGHEAAGKGPAETLMNRWMFPHDVVEAAIISAAEHLKPGALYKDLEAGKITDEQYDNAVRKLLKRIDPVSWRVIIAIAESDWRGRTLPGVDTDPYKAGERFREAVQRLSERDELAKTLLQGRDLLSHGIKPGKRMGEIIQEAENARDRGEIKTREDALNWLAERVKREASKKLSS